MSGVAVIVAKLQAYGALTAIVPAARIMAGELPIDTALPAIEVKQISSVPRNIVSMSAANVLHTDRVQVTVLVAGLQTSSAGTGYAGLRSILKLVLAACPQSRAVVGSIKVDSITPDVEGPDMASDAPAMQIGSRDFLIRWIGP